eukprot:11458905-Heterocapsa_arctica.AAC.1
MASEPWRCASRAFSTEGWPPTGVIARPPEGGRPTYVCAVGTLDNPRWCPPQGGTCCQLPRCGS